MPRPEDIAAGRTKDWPPKFPDFAVSPEQGTYDEPQSGGAEYERAPADSHVYGFKLLAGGWVKKFYAPSVNAPTGTVAIVEVAFKPAAVNGVYPDSISSEYEYYFTSVGEAEAVMGSLRGAAHPGEVVHAVLIRGRVPYKRKSG